MDGKGELGAFDKQTAEGEEIYWMLFCESKKKM